jgi:L-fuculose-phosphate aldolase
MEQSTIPLERERAEIAAVCRRLAAEGLVVGTAGNVSVRSGDLVAVTATGASFNELAPDQITVVDLHGRVVGGELEPTSEIDLHLGVYKRYGAAAVVHTHAPAATALSCVCDELPVVHYALLSLGGAIRVAPYATFGTPELAQSVLDALEGRNGALMANHGATTHAASLAKAVELMQVLEWTCDVYARAVALGTPRILDEQQQLAVIAAAIERKYGTTQSAQKEKP